MNKKWAGTLQRKTETLKQVGFPTSKAKSIQWASLSDFNQTYGEDPIIKRPPNTKPLFISAKYYGQISKQRKILRFISKAMATAADCCQIYKLKAAVIIRTHITKKYLNRRELALLTALKARSDSWKKATISFVVSVRQCVHRHIAMALLGSSRADFREILYWVLLLKCV